MASPDRFGNIDGKKKRPHKGRFFVWGEPVSALAIPTILLLIPDRRGAVPAINLCVRTQRFFARVLFDKRSAVFWQTGAMWMAILVTRSA